MGSAFLILLREGLEAILIVVIVLAYLKQLGREDAFRAVWWGIAGAVGVSAVAAWAANRFLGGFEGELRLILFGSVFLAATGVLTYMVFWMARQARHIKGQLQRQVDQALEVGTFLAMASVVFFGVLREGLETALFMLAVVRGVAPWQWGVGGLLGLAVAAAIGYSIYQGGRRVNLRGFFQVTGFLILLLAAGLLAKGITYLQVAGVIPTFRIDAIGYSYPLWDLRHIPLLNPQETVFAQFLSGFFGWDPVPSLLEVAAYFVYLVLGSWLYFRAIGGTPATRAAQAVENRTDLSTV